MLPFKKILKELVESTFDASGAILADWEGESVEQFCLNDAYELKVTAAHKGIILNQLKEILSGLSVGNLQEVIISTETKHVIVGAVGTDYSLVMTLDSRAALGLALHRFHATVQLLVKEIY